MKNTFILILRNGPFVVSLIAVIIAGCLGLIKGVDISSLLPTLLGLYLGHRVTTAVSAHVCSVKDVDGDVNASIRDTEGIIVNNESTPSEEKEEQTK